MKPPLAQTLAHFHLTSLFAAPQTRSKCLSDNDARGASRTRTGLPPRDFKLNRPAGLAAHTSTRAPRPYPVNPTITTTSPHVQRTTLTCTRACCASSYDWLGHKRGTVTRGVLTPLAPGRAGPDTDQITQRDDCEPGSTGESYPRRKDSVGCRPLLKRGDPACRVEREYRVEGSHCYSKCSTGCMRHPDSETPPSKARPGDDRIARERFRNAQPSGHDAQRAPKRYGEPVGLASTPLRRLLLLLLCFFGLQHRPVNRNPHHPRRQGIVMSCSACMVVPKG